jgi:hypothetical protein
MKCSHRNARDPRSGAPIRTAKTVVLKGRVCGNKGRRSGKRLLRRGRYHSSRGPRSGPEAPRHVHRIHRSERSAPPRMGGRRQLGRRSHGRPCHAHRRDHAGRRGLPGDRRRRRHPGGPVPQEPQGLDGRNCHDDAARRREVRRQGLSGVRWAARRGHLRGQRPVHPSHPRSRPGRPALGGRIREGRKNQAEDRRRRPGAESSTRPSSGPRPSPSACRSWPF